MVIVMSAPLLAQGDSQDDDGSTSDQLLAEFEAHQDEAIVNETDHQRTDDSTLLPKRLVLPSTAAAITDSSSPSPS